MDTTPSEHHVPATSTERLQSLLEQIKDFFFVKPKYKNTEDVDQAGGRESEVLLSPKSYLWTPSGKTADKINLLSLSDAQETYPQADLQIRTLLHPDFGGDDRISPANLTLLTATAQRKLNLVEDNVRYALAGLYHMYRGLLEKCRNKISTNTSKRASTVLDS